MGGTIPIGEFCRQVGVFLGEVFLQHMESGAKGIKCTSVMDENLRTA